MNRQDTHDAIRLSLLLGDSTADRHGVYARRKPPVLPLPVPPHVFVMPVVTETQRPAP